MADIKIKDIKHLAKLANLSISIKETTKFQKQLSLIVSYVGELSKVDTSNTLPTSQTTGLKDIKRKDLVETKDSLSLEETFSGTESKHNNFFKVPAVFDN